MYVEGEGGHTSPYAMAGRIYFRTEFLSEYVLVKANSWTNGQIFLEIRVATDAQYMAVFDMVNFSVICMHSTASLRTCGRSFMYQFQLDYITFK